MPCVAATRSPPPLTAESRATLPLETRVGSGPALTARPQTGTWALVQVQMGAILPPLFSQQIRACFANSDVEEQWQLFPCEKMGSQTDVCFTRENLGTRFWKHFVRGRCEATVDTAHGLPPSGRKGWRQGAPWKPTRAWSGEPPGTAPWKCGPGTLNKGNWDAWLTRGCPPRARPALELGCGTGWNRRPRASAPRVQPSSGPARTPRPSGVPGHRAGRWCPGGSVTGPVCVPRPRSWACSL